MVSDQIRQKPIDPLWASSVALLLVLGTLAVFSSSGVLSLRSLGDEYYYLKRHLLFLGVGAFFYFLGSRISIDFLRKFTYPLLGVAWLMTWLCLIPSLAIKAGGASRWLNFKFFAFQPVELLKFTIILYLAHSLAKKGSMVTQFSKGFIPHVVVAIIAVLPLLLQPDLGSTVLILTLVLVMLFVSGARLAHLSLLFLVQAPFIGILIATSPYRVRRILAFLDPWSDPHNRGYQIIQSMVAFFNGATTGVGWGASQGKLFYLPAAHTDFILAVIGEELGFTGIVGVVFLFIFFFSRTVLFAQNAKDLFQKFLIIGIAFSIIIQMMMNAFVVMGLLPTKGLTLPFISYGGSSLVMILFMCGLIHNVARQRTLS